ncbi:hypothetical protein FGF1_25500 [Flavobacteriaceae bacterium GF1]
MVFIVLACKNDDDTIEPDIDGAYTGIFERNGNTSNVTLNLNDGMYSGESDTEVFPAICSGNYSISNDSITFTDECFWTADFDWTLILNEEWNYSLNGSTLILTKNNGDKYTLTKQ